MTIKVKMENLQATRIKNGLSLRALSKVAGLSSATIFKIEKDGTPPNPSTAKKICDALGVEFGDLFELVSKKGI